MAASLLRSGISGQVTFSMNMRYLLRNVRHCSGVVRPRLNVGTIGHIDHGKTTLTAAITRVLETEGRAKFLRYDQIDRAPEEKARGITINACHVGYSTPTRDYSHTDCPGHIDYIKNMIVGTSQMDGAVLVVAATDGMMPQTKEHVMLARQIGVKNLVVYVNKADLVDQEMLELVHLEIAELLEELGYKTDAIPFVYGSALCALKDTQPDIGRDSIQRLLDHLDSLPLPDRRVNGPFILPIENVVTVPGRGTVIVGTILEGCLSRGDPAIIQGFNKTFKSNVASIGLFDQSVETARAGDNVGILVRSVKREALERGMFVSHPDAGLTQHDAFNAQIYAMSRAEGGRHKPIMNKYIQNLFMDTWNMTSLLRLQEQTFVMPGDSIQTEVILRSPMVVRPGTKFFIREGQNTTVSGVVTELLPPTDFVMTGFNRDNRNANKVVIESNSQVVLKKKYESLARQRQRETPTGKKGKKR